MMKPFKKLNPELKGRVVRALRTTTRKQARGWYCDDNTGSCCALGVIREELSGDPRGCSSEYSSIDIVARDAIVSLNDRGHKSFKYIANWVEKNL